MARPLFALAGAFDRHNFGDLLFPHILDALLPPGERRCVGLAARDLRPWGGHAVRTAVPRQPVPAAVIHAGGEILDTSAWEAAVMLAPDGPAMAGRRGLPDIAAAAWAGSILGIPDRAPYVFGEDRCGAGVARVFNAVGGSGLAHRDPAFVAEVTAKLATAAHVGVRDRVTRDFLAAHGIAAALTPAPAAIVARLFGPAVARRRRQGAAGELGGIWRGGYLALQFSADYGDDATLDALAAALRAWPADRGIALFQAGAAPWHDDPAVYRRLAARLPARRAVLFESLHWRDIVALLAGAAAFAGSSLHGRIVATAFGVPAVSLRSEGTSPGKVAAYLATWEDDAAPVTPATLAPALAAALAGGYRRRDLAEALADAYLRYFRSWSAALWPRSATRR